MSRVTSFGARETAPEPLLVRPFHASHLAWWLSLGLIGVAALLARRSRIAAWAALPIAFAGGQLASHFLEQLLLHLQPVS